MTETFNIAVLVGSLRKDSLNHKLAKAITALAPQNLAFSFAEIGNLALYNPDLDGPAPPPAWVRFRQEITTADAILFVTPEYNRSVPAALKNALDVASRPVGKNVWIGKPAAIVTGSMGAMGGFGANHALRQSLVSLNAPTMPAPEAYIGGMATLFNANGALVKDETNMFLTHFMSAFAAWIERHAKF